MKWLTFEIRREPGFRFNLLDLILIGVVGAISGVWYVLIPYQQLYLLPLYVLGSFFLFCNVFRIGNRLESGWYGSFVVIAGYGLTRTEFPWMFLLLVCEAIKWSLIGYQIRYGVYVGAFYRQLSVWNVRRRVSWPS